jgi:hypothetical protein
MRYISDAHSHRTDRDLTILTQMLFDNSHRKCFYGTHAKLAPIKSGTHKKCFVTDRYIGTHKKCFVTDRYTITFMAPMLLAPIKSASLPTAIRSLLWHPC